MTWRKWYDAHKHPCPICGKPINSKAKHCRKHRPFYWGEQASNWKGGRVQVHRYIKVMNPRHRKADGCGYVFEHLLVWETTHHKELPAGWVIHHLNGIGTDNRPANLVALPTMKHNLLLQAKAQRIQELEGLLNCQYQFM